MASEGFHRSIWKHLEPLIKESPLKVEIEPSANHVYVSYQDDDRSTLEQILEQARTHIATDYREVHPEIWQQAAPLIKASGLDIELSEDTAFVDLVFPSQQAEDIDALLVRAEGRVPLTFYISKLEWQLLEPQLGERSIQVDSEQYPTAQGIMGVAVTFSQEFRDEVDELIKNNYPVVSARQPAHSIFMVSVEVRGRHEDGCFAVAADSAEAASERIASRYDAYQVTNVCSLAEYQETHEPLDPEICPRLGEHIRLEFDS